MLCCGLRPRKPTQNSGCPADCVEATVSSVRWLMCREEPRAQADISSPENSNRETFLEQAALSTEGREVRAPSSSCFAPAHGPQTPQSASGTLRPVHLRKEVAAYSGKSRERAQG